MKLKSQKKKKTVIIAIIVAAVILVGAIVAGLVLVLPSIGVGGNKTEVTGIMVNSSPSKMVYYVGEKFDPTGLVIQVIANNNDGMKRIDGKSSELKYSGFDSSVANDKVTVTVSYQGFTTTFNVKVLEQPKENPTITSIALSDGFRTSYSVSRWNNSGPSFFGVNLICTYSDGTVKEVQMEMLYCSDIVDVDGPGETQFTIKYTDENGYTAETTVTVTITN